MDDQESLLRHQWDTADASRDGPGFRLLSQMAAASNPALAAQKAVEAAPVIPGPSTAATLAEVIAGAEGNEVTIPKHLLAGPKQRLPGQVLMMAAKWAEVIDLRGGCDRGKTHAADQLVGVLDASEPVLGIAANRAIAGDVCVRFAHHNFVLF